MSFYFKVQPFFPIGFILKKCLGNAVVNTLAFVITIFSTNLYSVEHGAKTQAIPLDAESAIIEAFSTHDIVALGEGGHTNEQSHAFRMNLISNSRFPKTVNDIVVEFGNSYYQPMMDRFIAGEDIPHKEIRKAWLFTTQLNQTLDNPVYEEFIYKVRTINKSLPDQQKMRVWLGDPPMNWKNINSKEDLDVARKYLNRDDFVVHLIKYDILAQGRKAILLYGDRHFHRKRLYWGFKNPQYAEKYSKLANKSIVTQLEQAKAKVFSITANTRFNLEKIQVSVTDWNRPSLSLLEGNILGSIPYAEYYLFSVHPINEQGIRVPVESIASKSPKMEEQYNAVLYLGPIDSITYRKLPDDICQDEEYIKIRLKSLRFIKREKDLIDYCKNKLTL